ncbi:MAG: prolipoprotein diacylglyceryl transferase [Clostridia bacterium]|nr:prolipoprotein diacylglyceryl transferase [Clostridia bacterium]
MLLANPVAFSIGNFSVYWYGIIITSAILGGTIFAMFEAKRRGMKSDYVLTLFLWVVPFAVIFARLFYVIFHIGDFLPINSFEDVIAIISTREGGITIIGAVPGGALGAYIATKTNKTSYIETLDMAAPCMILGQALGRWGNFVNQELYGQQILNETFQKFPFAVQIDRHVVYNAAGEYVETIYNGWYQATFFYEMMLNYLGFAVLLILSRKYKRNGIIFVAYLAWYGVVRAVMELIRTDAISIAGVKIGVVGGFAAATIAIVIILLIWLGKIKTATPSHLLKAECVTVSDSVVLDNAAANYGKIEDNDDKREDDSNKTNSDIVTNNIDDNKEDNKDSHNIENNNKEEVAKAVIKNKGKAYKRKEVGGNKNVSGNVDNLSEGEDKENNNEKQ